MTYSIKLIAIMLLATLSTHCAEAEFAGNTDTTTKRTVADAADATSADLEPTSVVLPDATPPEEMLEPTVLLESLNAKLITTNTTTTTTSDTSTPPPGDTTPAASPTVTTPAPSPEVTTPVTTTPPPAPEIDCSGDAIVDANATYRTPLSVTYRTGDMGRNSTPFATKNFLSAAVGNVCTTNRQASVPSESISADRTTRNAVCRLYGYAAAIDDANFGYFQFLSPADNYRSYFNNTDKKLNIKANASLAPMNNRVLVWTMCKGKRADICTKKYIEEFKCTR